LVRCSQEDAVDWERLQHDWDAQQQTYLPDREERFTAMLDAVEALVGDAPRILDLAGGTGSITLRARRRFPKSTSVLVDVDAALLRIAAGTFAADERVQVLTADLATPDWLESVPSEPGQFDAVLTATALHWLPAERVAQVYAEAGSLLASPGLFANADHMPDDGLPTLTDKLLGFRESRRVQVTVSAGATDWEGWWDRLRDEPELAAAVAARDARFAERRGSAHTESEMPVSWHAATLRAAGFSEAGLVWRGLADGIVVGLR
jgi:SAM-dependent methyltransferase